MLPIQVMYDAGLSYYERSAVKEAIQEFEKLFPERQIRNLGATAWSKGEYSCADWYIEHAQSANEDQLEAKSLIELMSQEPGQNIRPYINMLFTSRDLTTWYLDFCFGLTVDRYTVQSVYRHRELTGDDAMDAIKAMFWHELGYLLGAASDKSRTNTDDEYGIVHCRNFGCIMRNSMTSAEMVRYAKDAMRKKSIYCPQCIEDIRRSRI